MKYLLIIAISFSILMISCHNVDNSEEVAASREVKLSYFETVYGWGYDIKINGKDYIHQENLPCQCGREGFKTKEKAALAAEFLKEKIINNDRFITVSKTQLDSLGAL